MMTLLLILLFDALKEETEAIFFVIEDNDDDTSLPASETTVGDSIESENVAENRGAAATREEADEKGADRFFIVWRNSVKAATLFSSLQGADRFLVMRRGAMVVSVATLFSSSPLPLS